MASKEKYYMPYGAQDFLIWARYFVETARAGKEKFGFSEDELAPLDAAVDRLNHRLVKAVSGSASSADKRAKNTALRDAQVLFRGFVNRRVRYNDRIDAESRRNLRTHVHDDIRTNIPVPDDFVRLRIRPLEGHGHRIDFVSASTGKKAIPYGMNGVLLRRKILDADEPVPIRAEDLPETELLTASPHNTDYNPEFAGKRVAYSAAWENAKGQPGKFSDVEVYIIP
jgi:hypothetical protein